MKTKYWHTFIEGYRARVKEIARNRNWYMPVRPNTQDSNEWFAGWDLADSDINK